MSVRHPSRSLWFPILSILGVYVVASMLLGRLFQQFDTAGGQTAWSGFVTYVVSFGFTIGYAVALRRGWGLEVPSFRPERWGADPRVIVVGLVLMLAVGVVLSPVLDRMPDTYVEMLDRYMSGGFWSMFTAVVAAPVLEEFLFRGIIQKNLVRRLGPVAGIAVGASIFGAIHLIPQQVIYAACLGLILGTVYYLTGSLNSAIAIHFVNNGLTSLLYMVFGTADGVERRILGDGALWGWTYAVSVALLAVGGWYGVRRIRRQEAAEADPEARNGDEN